MDGFKTFGPKKSEIGEIALKKLIEEVSSSFYKDFKSSNSLKCPENLVSYLKRSLCLLLNNTALGEDKKTEKLIKRYALMISLLYLL